MVRFAKLTHFGGGHFSVIKKPLDGYTQPHSHDFYEIEFFLHGSGSYTMDGVEYSVVPGCLFFMSPTNIHTVCVQDSEIYNLMFSAELCDPGLIAQLTARSPIALNLQDGSIGFFCALFDELITLQDQPQYAQLLLGSVLVKLCTLTQTLPEKPTMSVISRSELYIRSHLKESLTLSQVAQQFGFSPNYFSTLFSAQTGVSFHNYVQTLRYDLAKKLLRCSQMTVIQICEECGFRDYPNFVRRFRQQTGLTPTQYRKNGLSHTE